jgi:hypothetical protein
MFLLEKEAIYRRVYLAQMVLEHTIPTNNMK